MNWKTTAIFLAGLLLSSCQAPASNTATTANNSAPANTQKETAAAKKAPPTNMQQLAQRIVNQSAGVKEGEIVMVSGSARDADLLENLVIEIEKVGGNALLTMNSENIAKRLYTDVPEKYDTAQPKLGMALAKIVNVSINVDSSESDALLKDIPPARLETRAKASLPVGKEFRTNKIRSIAIGNDLYPTEWRAKRFDMPIDGFAKLFWDGLNVDYVSLQTTGEKARTALAGKEVEVTHSNGTSIKATIDSKPAYISDGIVSADDVAKGDLDVFLPAGEAVVLPSANSGTGKFVIEKQYFNGQEVRNLVLNFENGKLTSMTGEGDGFAAMKADYDARGPGKEILSFVDVGINPSYTLAPSSKLGNWISAGMVTLGTGNNMWAGGTSDATGGVSGHLAGCTVKIDGKVVVDNGVLKL